MEDSEIVELFFARSEKAINALSEKYAGPIRRLARNMLHSDRDAEECENDTYLAVWNTIPPQRPVSLAGYVLRIARNISRDRYRANTARKRNSSYDTALAELEQCLPSGETAEDICAARELAAEIDAFLGTLAPDERRIFVRRYWFSDSVSDIAGMTGSTANLISVKLHRTREKLRRYLTDKGAVI